MMLTYVHELPLFRLSGEYSRLALWVKMDCMG